MGFLERVLIFLVERALARLLIRSQKQYVAKQEIVFRDIGRGLVDEKNLKDYNEAKARSIRIGKALNLLNRTRPSNELRGDSKVPDEGAL